MTYTRLAGLLLAAMLATTVDAQTVGQGMYTEGFIGRTLSPSVDLEEGEYSLESETDIAVGLVVGRVPAENIRVEGEISYLKTRWDAGEGVNVTADGFGIGANLLFAFSGYSTTMMVETGAGFGWTFLDEACIKADGIKLCDDADTDDWTVQWIFGVLFPLSEEDAIAIRYRMKNIGGFSSDDRLHMYTVGYRRKL